MRDAAAKEAAAAAERRRVLSDEARQRRAAAAAMEVARLERERAEAERAAAAAATAATAAAAAAASRAAAAAAAAAAEESRRRARGVVVGRVRFRGRARRAGPGAALTLRVVGVAAAEAAEEVPPPAARGAGGAGAACAPAALAAHRLARRAVAAFEGAARGRRLAPRGGSPPCAEELCDEGGLAAWGRALTAAAVAHALAAARDVLAAGAPPDGVALSFSCARELCPPSDAHATPAKLARAAAAAAAAAARSGGDGDIDGGDDGGGGWGEVAALLADVQRCERADLEAAIADGSPSARLAPASADLAAWVLCLGALFDRAGAGCEGACVEAAARALPPALAAHAAGGPAWAGAAVSAASPPRGGDEAAAWATLLLGDDHPLCAAIARVDPAGPAGRAARAAAASAPWPDEGAVRAARVAEDARAAPPAERAWALRNAAASLAMGGAAGGALALAREALACVDRAVGGDPSHPAMLDPLLDAHALAARLPGGGADAAELGGRVCAVVRRLAAALAQRGGPLAAARLLHEAADVVGDDALRAEAERLAPNSRGGHPGVLRETAARHNLQLEIRRLKKRE